MNRIKRVRKYLNELIEKYFSAFLDEVTERGVSVNETMGDGFMAIFQQPNPMQNAAAATETALGVFAATERINRDSKEQPIEVHIGISSGKALVGSTQFHGRHGTRWVFSASRPARQRSCSVGQHRPIRSDLRQFSHEISARGPLYR